jgi:hypothetical protein
MLHRRSGHPPPQGADRPHCALARPGSSLSGHPRASAARGHDRRGSVAGHANSMPDPFPWARRTGRASCAVRAEDDVRDRPDRPRSGRASVAQRQKKVKGVTHGATAHSPHPRGPPAALDFIVPICVVWVWVEQKTYVLPGERQAISTSRPTTSRPTTTRSSVNRRTGAPPRG